MANYWVNDNAQDNGDHEVHKEGCPYLPQIISKTYLGNFFSCSNAVAEARKKYPTSDGCATCIPECHTS
ncbi:MAG: hypothetical protein OXC41_04855 [Gammaproteobacteria bacterium]|nr:hypothetical protein [Gammaproteobacteria bacterium]